MAKFPLRFATTFIALLLISLSFGINVKLADGQEETWCVAKPSTDDSSLAEILNFICSVMDCGFIKQSGPCFEPDTYISHASVAMNHYYRTRGRNPWNCYFNGYGIIVSADPSYRECKYD